MPGTGPSHHRSGKSSRNQPGTSYDAGKRKTSIPRSKNKRSEHSPPQSSHSISRSKHTKGSDSSDADWSPTASKSQIGAHSQREESPNSFKVPAKEAAPIRDLIKKVASEKQAVRPKDPKPKSIKDARPTPSTAKNSSKSDLQDARKKAADAAISRLEHSSKSMGFARGSASKVSNDQLAVQSVLHVCPLVSNEVLHSREWRPKIMTYLTQLSRTEKELAAVLTIHTLNPSKEKVDECVQILVTYLKNILSDPKEEKYRAIKMTNKVFSEKVLPIKGAVEFLDAAGFRKDEKIEADGKKMDVLCLQGNPDLEKLEMLIDSLQSAEPVLPQVYRDPMVLMPKEAEDKVYLPDDFYDLTEKELAEMYKKNMQKIDGDNPLMTKAMREKEERKHLVKYKYTVLRVRFPDAVVLQGTFGRLDTQKSVKEFVNSCLIKPFKYSLFCPITKSALLDADDNKTLFDLKLVPSVVLNFTPDDKDKFPKVYLKPELAKKAKII